MCLQKQLYGLRGSFSWEAQPYHSPAFLLSCWPLFALGLQKVRVIAWLLARNKGHSPLTGVPVIFDVSKGKVFPPGWRICLSFSRPIFIVASLPAPPTCSFIYKRLVKGGTPPVTNPSARLSFYMFPRPQYWHIFRSASKKPTTYLPKTRTVYSTLIFKKLSLAKHMLTWIHVSRHTNLYTRLWACCVFLSFRCRNFKCFSFISWNKCEYKIAVMLLSCPGNVWNIAEHFKSVVKYYEL